MLSNITPFACSVSDAMRLSSIGRTKLYELINAGVIRTTKVGRRTLVDVSSLRALVAGLPQGNSHRVDETTGAAT